MIERSQFDEQLFQLRRIILDGLSYFIVWQGLNAEFEKGYNSPTKEKDFWWHYRGFLAPTRKALSGSALIQLSKAFDKDTRNISIGKTLRLILENDEELAPYATKDTLNTIMVKIVNNTELLKRLKRYRDKRLAHHDAELRDNIELPPEQVRTLIEETKSIFNSIKYSHEGKYDDFDDIMQDVKLTKSAG
jgi:hypothetical protein